MDADSIMNPFKSTFLALTLTLALGCCITATNAGDPGLLKFPGGDGPGRGKHIVFLAGDEEYRSEEGLPMLAKILAVHHGFNCTVLFSLDPASGEIDPNNQTHIPGMAQLDSADLMVMLLRFRELSDADMKHFVDYLNSGKPIIGLRTSTHAFAYSRNKQSPYARFDWRSTDWPGGFGRQVLGDTWISHHGDHGKESTRGLINPEHKNHPILRGVTEIWGPSDVYGLKNLPDDTQVLVHGQVLAGMNPADPPVSGAKNDPLIPVVWLRNYVGETGRTSRIVTTTMGASTDFESEGLRRLVVNASYWAAGLEARIPTQAKVEYIGTYRPTPFGFNKYTRGIKPADHALK
jgi:hypothetical protein